MHERMEFPKQSIPGNQHMTDVHGRLYDVYRLIHEARALPIIEMSVPHLFDKIVDHSYWNDRNKKSITIREVCEALIVRDGRVDWSSTLRAHPNLAEHLQKIRDADYSYPIILLQEYGIIDGIHRLTKAHLDGALTIPTRQFEHMPESAIDARKIQQHK